MSLVLKAAMVESDLVGFEANRKICLQQQTLLRELMEDESRFQGAIELFMIQHACLHAAKVSLAEPDFHRIWSYEDSILAGVSEEQFRQLPYRQEHSIAWCIWHIARIEDVAMNLLVADSSQIFILDSWQERLGVNVRDTGNAMDLSDVTALSTQVDLSALRAYRIAVGHRTREIVRELSAQDLKRKVERDRLQRVMDEGAVVEAARGVVEYWRKRTFAGLLLMPATRHSLVHLNEALNLKRAI